MVELATLSAEVGALQLTQGLGCRAECETVDHLSDGGAEAFVAAEAAAVLRPVVHDRAYWLRQQVIRILFVCGRSGQRLLSFWGEAPLLLHRRQLMMVLGMQTCLSVVTQRRVECEVAPV